MARKRKRRTPGSGTIRKLSGTFKAAYPNPAGGHWTRNFDSLAEAEAWLDTFAKRKEKRLGLTGGQQLTGTWLQTWLNGRPAHLKPTTKEDYSYKLGLWSDLAEIPLFDLSADIVDDAQREIGRTIGDTTAKQARGLLKRALQEAVRRRYLDNNPAESERTSRPPQKPRRRLNAHQARVLCEATDGFYAAAWPLMVCCGMRPGELCGLRRGDVDLDTCVLHLRQGVSDVRGKATIQDTLKTPASTRVVPFPRAHAPAIRAHLERLTQRATLGSRRETWREHGLVFPGKSGKPLNPTSLRHALKDVTDAARLPPVTSHELRHTAAGLLESLDAPEHIIAGILGHGPKKITRRYAPPSVDTMRPWIERVWGLLWPDEEKLRRVR